MLRCPTPLFPLSRMIPTRTLLRVLGRYALAMVLLNLAWEVAQMPLYTLWWTASARDIVFAVLHCTAGDLLVAIVAFLLAIVLFGRRDWPERQFIPVALTIVVLGVGYTAFSEWLNVYVRATWAYSAWMPIIPGTGIGLSPMLQWIFIPAASLAWIRH